MQVQWAYKKTQMHLIWFMCLQNITVIDKTAFLEKQNKNILSFPRHIVTSGVIGLII